MIKNAKKKFNNYPNAKFIAADIIKEQIFNENFFDYILFAGTGHHLPDRSLIEILNILIPMLKKTGSLHFIDIIRDDTRSSFLLNWLLKHDQGKFVRNKYAYKNMFDKNLTIAKSTNDNEFPIKKN